MQNLSNTLDSPRRFIDNAKMAGMELLSIAELLKRREQSRDKELILTLIVGMALSLVLPVLMGTMAYGAYRQFSSGGGSWLAWITFVVLFAAIFLPLLILREKSNIAPETAIIRTREDEDHRRVVSVQQSEMDLQSFGPLGMQLNDDQESNEHWLIRPFFFGPRLIVRAFPQRKLLQLLAANTDRPRAAEVLVKLASRDRGLPTTDLLKPGEAPGILTPTLAYLRQLDWVDCSADGSRIWLNSNYRDQVAAVLNTYAPPSQPAKGR
jgi:hypothetical protein